MLLSIAADEHAAMVFEDLASALDAGLPLASLGGDPAAGDRVLHELAAARGVRLSPTEATVLQHGWRSGRGGEALRGRARERLQRAQFARSVWEQLRYPLLLFAMLFVASLATSAFVGTGIAVVLAIAYTAVAIAVFVVWRAARRGAAGVERWPFVGKLFVDLRELPYLETLHGLYGAGVPIVEAHAAAVGSVRMRDLRARLEIAQGLLQNGESLRDALAQSAALGVETRTLLANGELAGQLEEALSKALTRRQQVAARTLATAARRVGQVAYVVAVAGVVVIVFRFYGNYFSMIGGGRP